MENKNIGVIFSGQGSQYENMGRDILLSDSKGRAIYECAEKILDKETFDIIKEARLDDLSKTRYSQLAIFLNSLALFKEVEDDLEIRSFAGLSLGEYTALCASKKINVDQGISLVKTRGEIMSEGVKNNGSMIAVSRPDIGVLETIISKTRESDVLSISNFNSPMQVVVGGSFSALDRFEEECKNLGIKKLVRLDVEGPFHTEILEESSRKFKKILDGVDFLESDYEVYSNVGARKYSEIKDFGENLKRQMYTPVYFQKCIEEMISDQINVFIEIGPGRALSGFVKKINKEVKTYNIQNLEEAKKVIDEVVYGKK